MQSPANKPKSAIVRSLSNMRAPAILCSCGKRHGRILVASGVGDSGPARMGPSRGRPRGTLRAELVVVRAGFLCRFVSVAVCANRDTRAEVHLVSRERLQAPAEPPCRVTGLFSQAEGRGFETRRPLSARICEDAQSPAKPRNPAVGQDDRHIRGDARLRACGNARGRILVASAPATPALGGCRSSPSAYGHELCCPCGAPATARSASASGFLRSRWVFKPIVLSRPSDTRYRSSRRRRTRCGRPVRAGATRACRVLIPWRGRWLPPGAADR